MYKKFITLLTLGGLLIYGCFEIPPEPVMPTWDVNMSLPLLEKKFTIKELIEKDTSIIKVDANNQLYFSDKVELEPTVIGDNLTIDDISTSASSSIGNFQIKSPGAISATISPTQIFPGLDPNIPPGYYPIPSNDPGQEISTEFTAFENFQSITFDDGVLRVTVQNNLPVPLQFPGGLVIYPADNPGSPIGVLFENVSIDSNSTRSDSINLAGKILPSNLGLNVTIYSPGSGGEPVYLDINKMSVKISAALERLSIASATARIPAQPEPIKIEDSFILEPDEPQPNLIDEVVFKSGTLQIQIKNNIDLGLEGILTLYNFKHRATDQELKINFNIGRRNSPFNIYTEVIDLSQYKLILRDSLGNPGNELLYKVEVRTEDTGDEYRTISKDDSISASFSLQNLKIESISGKVKPTKVEFESDTLMLELGDYRRKFKGEIQFDDVEITLKLYKSTLFTFDLNLKVVGINTKTGQIDSLELPPDQVRFSGNTHTIVLNKNNSNIVNFLNFFGREELPEFLILRGSVFLNPEYEYGKVTSQDSIYGSISIRFPLNIGISNAVFQDTSEVQISQELEKQVENVNYGKMYIEIENGTPIGLYFKVVLMDSLKADSINFPKGDFFKVVPALVDASGFASEPQKYTNIFELTKNDAEKLKNMKWVISSFKMETSGGKVVKFRTTDYIRVKIYANLNLRINFDKN